MSLFSKKSGSNKMVEKHYYDYRVLNDERKTTVWCPSVCVSLPYVLSNVNAVTIK